MKYKCFFLRTSVFFMLGFLLSITSLLFVSPLYGTVCFDTVSAKEEVESFIQLDYHRGMLYPHRGSLIYFNEDYINGLSLRAGRTFPEISTSSPPRIGGGIYISNLGNKEVYGQAFAAYAYFGNQYLNSSGFFNVGSSVSAGLSYNNRPFHPITNVYNQAIGLSVNAFFIFGLDFIFFQNQNVQLTLGPSMVHLSNGKLRVPNSGLNLYNLRLGLTYKPNRPVLQSSSVSNLRKMSANLKGFFTAGIRQQNHFLAHREFVSSSILEYTQPLGRVRRIGIGLNYFYSSGKISPVDNLDEYEYIVDSYYGFHVAYDIVWGKLSFALNPGVRFWYDHENHPFYFTRIGVRYEFLPGLLLNCSLKSHSFIAEYIEWGLGYSLNFE